MRRPVGNLKPVISSRLAFLFMFTLFYWVFRFLFQKINLQISQVVFNLAAGVFSGAVTHVAVAKLFGPLLFGRGFCGWACWNASVFEVLPVGRNKKKVPEKYLAIKYMVLALVLIIPFVFIFAETGLQASGAQLKWLLTENAVIYVVGIILAFVLGDSRAFCKYLCPAGALMTLTSPRSIIKIEKNNRKCLRCRRCEDICPMGVPVLNYISAGQRVSHPECILCTECVKQCPGNCLTVGIGRKAETTTASDTA